MSTKSADPIAVEKKPVSPPKVVDTVQRGACVEFVEYCKEQFLSAQAARMFLRVLHNKSWEHEVEQIRERMRPEVDELFLPVERALAEGADCRAVLDKLVNTLETRK